MPTDPRLDAYHDRQPEFAKPILHWLRERFQAACPAVEETIKWSHPAFYYKGKPLAGFAAFKAHASFGFWDPLANAQGKDTGIMQRERISSLAELPDAAAIEGQIRHAVALIDAGRTVKRVAKPPKPELPVPPELAEALAGDEAASATFDAFPPSCRREYCEWIAEAKRPETKAKRVAEAVGWMREGKRRNWKYENC